MLNHLDFYYFSPTGGTRKAGAVLAEALAQDVISHDLTGKNACADAPAGEVTLFAMPVFSGRIPALAAEKLKQLKGAGRPAVSLVIYGVRAYDDALLELNDLLQEVGFRVIASGAFVARHSVVPEVGAGRPDEEDIQELKSFGQAILKKLAEGADGQIAVPGNRPYKENAPKPVSAITMSGCGLCGACVDRCPSGAITLADDVLTTDAEKCFLCMACVHACPTGARMLPPPLQEQMYQKLIPLKDVRRENQQYL